MVFIVVALAVVGLFAGLAAGRIGYDPLSEPSASQPATGLPDQPDADDITAVRFDTALRGYRMDQVDDVLDHIQARLDARERELADREGELADRQRELADRERELAVLRGARYDGLSVASQEPALEQGPWGPRVGTDAGPDDGTDSGDSRMDSGDSRMDSGDSRTDPADPGTDPGDAGMDGGDAGSDGGSVPSAAPGSEG